LTQDGVTNEPIKISDNYVVVGVTKRTEADLAEFAKQRDTLVEQALSQRQSQVYQDFIIATRARMERDGDVKINAAVLDRIEQEVADAAPPITPGAGGLPPGLTFPPNG
jgi:hypothetical protein